MSSIKHKYDFVIPALAAVSLVFFIPSLRSGFVWEDSLNLVENTGWKGLSFRWWFSSFVAGDYKPAVWASYALDHAFWALNPFGYHLGNILLHSLNTALVGLVLFRLSQAKFGGGVRSALVAPCSGERTERSQLNDRIKSKNYSGEQPPGRWAAVIFASLFYSLHPLRVEAVSWVTGRKDLLSTFFYLLSVVCYVRYAENKMGVRNYAEEPRRPPVSHAQPWRWYLFSLLWAGCAFASKPMAVSLPAVLLLMDFFPLKRWGDHPGRTILEKVPYLVGALTITALAVAGQLKNHALTPLSRLNLINRFILAGYSGAFYIAKTVWPVNLRTVYIVYHSSWKFWAAGAGSAVFLLGVTAAAVILLKRKECMSAFGWFWYLTTWLPVSGLLQTGLLPLADRFTYLPALGFSFILADLSARRRGGVGKIFPALVAAVLIALGLLTVRQQQAWRSSLSLWGGMASSGSPVAHYNLGNALKKDGRLSEAIRHYRRALNLDPGYAQARYNLAIALGEAGQIGEAVGHYREALRRGDDLARVHNNLANLLVQQGKTEEAIFHYGEALRRQPELAEAHNNLANILAGQEKYAEAVEHYQQALRINPDYAEAYFNLGYTLDRRGEKEQAEYHYRRALSLKPDYPEAHYQLALLLLGRKRLPEAIGHLEETVRLRPGFEAAKKILSKIRNPKSEF